MQNRTVTRPHRRIRQARDHAKLSQSQLAEALKVHRSAVSQWEAPDGALPTLENLIKLAKLTEVQMEWLATGRGSMQFVENPDDVLGVIVDSYAHDHDEADVLVKYRGLKASEKKVMHDLLKILARKK